MNDVPRLGKRDVIPRVEWSAFSGALPLSQSDRVTLGHYFDDSAKEVQKLAIQNSTGISKILNMFGYLLVLREGKMGEVPPIMPEGYSLLCLRDAREELIGFSILERTRNSEREEGSSGYTNNYELVLTYVAPESRGHMEVIRKLFSACKDIITEDQKIEHEEEGNTIRLYFDRPEGAPLSGALMKRLYARNVEKEEDFGSKKKVGHTRYVIEFTYDLSLGRLVPLRG